MHFMSHASCLDASLHRRDGRIWRSRSEIFWDALENLRQIHSGLLEDPIDSTFLQAMLERFSAVVHARSGGLGNCDGFIDETVLYIARPSGVMQQRVVYNGKKRKHELKYQAVHTPDRLMHNLHGPIEGRRHD